MKDCILEKEEYVIKEIDGEKITVRQLQEEILTIMDEIDRVCKKNNIPYALHAGSALGSINYKGFIPWDDDVDIMIDLKDYKKFVKALKKDLDQNFYFQCFDTDKKYNVLISNMKIRKKNTYIEEENTLLKNRCKGDGIFVDVIWWSGASKYKFIDELFRLPIRIMMTIMVLLDNIHINPIPFKYLVEWISKCYGKLFEKSGYVSQTIAYPWIKFFKQPILKKEYIYPFKECEFENRKFMTYNNPVQVVHTWYGTNCTKKWDGKKWVETYPIEKRKTKHVRDLNLKSDKPHKKTNMK